MTKYNSSNKPTKVHIPLPGSLVCGMANEPGETPARIHLASTLHSRASLVNISVCQSHRAGSAQGFIIEIQSLCFCSESRDQTGIKKEPASFDAGSTQFITEIRGLSLPPVYFELIFAVYEVPSSNLIVS